MVDDKISSGLDGLGTAGVVGFTSGGVVAGRVYASGGGLAGAGVVGAGACGLEQPASSISPAAAIRILLNKVSLFDINLAQYPFRLFCA